LQILLLKRAIKYCLWQHSPPYGIYKKQSYFISLVKIRNWYFLEARPAAAPAWFSPTGKKLRLKLVGTGLGLAIVKRTW